MATAINVTDTATDNPPLVPAPSDAEAAGNGTAANGEAGPGDQQIKTMRRK